MQEEKFEGIAIGIFEDGSFTSNGKIVDEKLGGSIKEHLQYAGISGKQGEKYLFVNTKEQSLSKIIAVIGIGEQLKDELERRESSRVAAGTAIKFLKEYKCTKALLDDFGDAEGASEGSHLCAYVYDTLKTKKDKRIDISPLGSQTEEGKKGWTLGQIKAEAQNFSRMLMNTPSNFMTPLIFGQTVKEKIDALNSKYVEIKIHDRKWIGEQKMGCLESVTRGSDEYNPPIFLEMTYKRKDDQPFLGLVGKTICFDTGGISLKQPTGMEAMKGDMGGGACVVSTFWAIAKMELDVNLVVVAPACFNMPNGNATNPGDVFTAMNGSTVEVINTDAEGRLILCDALTYIQRNYKLNSLFDIATLTGAIGIALGDVYCGVFTNDNSLWEKIELSGRRSNELMWRMPLNKKYRKKINSDVATIKNVDTPKGSSCIAASFLQDFIEGNTKWAHFDMASVMTVGSGDPYLPPGMSGACTRTFIEFILSQLN